jgi:hypothetical protein
MLIPQHSVRDHVVKAFGGAFIIKSVLYLKKIIPDLLCCILELIVRLLIISGYTCIHFLIRGRKRKMTLSTLN